MENLRTLFGKKYNKIKKMKNILSLAMFNLTSLSESTTNAPNDEGLQLSPITIKEDYRKEWNVHGNDFMCLTKNGELINNSLYRLGGLNNPKLGTDKYFMLLKYVEAFYKKDILVMSKTTDPKHLESRWCIFDKDGNEKVEFDSFKSPYLVQDSCIYSISGNYHNIETNEHYCYAYSSMQSKDFLFLENSFGKDESKRGVMKINKKDGTWELFSGK